MCYLSYWLCALIASMMLVISSAYAHVTERYNSNPCTASIHSFVYAVQSFNCCKRASLPYTTKITIRPWLVNCGTIRTIVLLSFNVRCSLDRYSSACYWMMSKYILLLCVRIASCSLWTAAESWKVIVSEDLQVYFKFSWFCAVGPILYPSITTLTSGSNCILHIESTAKKLDHMCFWVCS